MKKKVLIISSSPRENGNSEYLCQSFMNGAKESNNDVDTVYLREKNLEYCIACDSCQRNGKCFKSDDVEEILQKMIKSDIIVLATPVYFYSLCAQLKTLIDRTYSRFTEIKNKDFYYILTAGDYRENEMVGTLNSLDGFVKCLPDGKVINKILGLSVMNKGEIINKSAVQESYEIGRNV